MKIEPFKLSHSSSSAFQNLFIEIFARKKNVKRKSSGKFRFEDTEIEKFLGLFGCSKAIKIPFAMSPVYGHPPCFDTQKCFIIIRISFMEILFRVASEFSPEFYELSFPSEFSHCLGKSLWRIFRCFSVRIFGEALR
jgi:hypothetical protein